MPPFDLEDPLELLHAHIALRPKAPEEIRSDIPRVLSAISMRNLAKSPDDRYRSLSGLQADLRECLRQLRENNSAVEFTPGLMDTSGRYVAPRRLYGREAELAALTADFEHSGPLLYRLVLFLDDLQWADASSFEIILRLVSRAANGMALQIIGAYRGDELPEGHPIRMSIEQIASGSLTRTITPGALEETSVKQFVAEALQIPEEHARSLASTVAIFSGGNLLLAGEFLKGLIERGRLRFDRENHSRDRDKQAIDVLCLSENEIDFLADRVERLPAENRKLLSAAACYGNRFRMAILRMACLDESASEIHSRLEAAARSGLVLLIRGEEPDPRDQNTGAGNDADEYARFSYRFAHDRVHQLIYESIEPEERSALHLRIGQGLRDATAAAQAGMDSERIFEIAHHLNLARERITAQSELLELARACQLGPGFLRHCGAADHPAFLSFRGRPEYSGCHRALRGRPRARTPLRIDGRAPA